MLWFQRTSHWSFQFKYLFFLTIYFTTSANVFDDFSYIWWFDAWFIWHLCCATALSSCKIKYLAAYSDRFSINAWWKCIICWHQHRMNPINEMKIYSSRKKPSLLTFAICFWLKVLSSAYTVRNSMCTNLFFFWSFKFLYLWTVKQIIFCRSYDHHMLQQAFERHSSIFY